MRRQKRSDVNEENVLPIEVTRESDSRHGCCICKKPEVRQHSTIRASLRSAAPTTSKGKTSTTSPSDSSSSTSTMTFSSKSSESTELDKVSGVKCGNCTNWMHLACLNWESFDAKYFSRVLCKKCGKGSIIKTELVIEAPHRLNPFLKSEKKMPMQVGSRKWSSKQNIEKMKSKFKTENYTIFVKNANELQKHWNSNGGLIKWKFPYVIKEGVSFFSKIPKADEFDMKNYIELGFKLDVIDSSTSEVHLVSLKRLLENDGTKQTLNVLSLNMALQQEYQKDVKVPNFVQRISVIHEIEKLKAWKNASFSKPMVHSFLVYSEAGCYTDFHIDFSGSSVYFHILKGEKVFWIAPPTQLNLDLYKMKETSKLNEKWMGDSLEKIQVLTLSAGMCLFMPAGYLHAVYTNEKTTAISGNFYTLSSMDIQIKVDYIERGSGMFNMKNFRETMSFATENLILPKLQRFNSIKRTKNPAAELVLEAGKELNKWLMSWAKEKKVSLKKERKVSKRERSEEMKKIMHEEMIAGKLKKVIAEIENEVPVRPSTDVIVLSSDTEEDDGLQDQEDVDVEMSSENDGAEMLEDENDFEMSYEDYDAPSTSGTANTSNATNVGPSTSGIDNSAPTNLNDENSNQVVAIQNRMNQGLLPGIAMSPQLEFLHIRCLRFACELFERQFTGQRLRTREEMEQLEAEQPLINVVEEWLETERRFHEQAYSHRRQ